jgi:hypothetical protein
MPTRLAAIGVFGVIVSAVLIAMYVVRRRRRRSVPSAIPLFLTLYVIALLPVIPFAISKTLTEGERLVYFASAFGLLLLVAVVDYIIGNIRTLAVTITCLAVASGVLLYRSEGNWRAAAGTASEITNSLEAVNAGGTLLVLSLPDNLKGAYIFRNGFREMLSLYDLEDKWEEVVVLATSSLRAPGDSIRIQTVGNLVRVTQSNLRSGFVRPNSRLQREITLAGCRIIEFDRSSYTFELNPVPEHLKKDQSLPSRLAYWRFAPAAFE